MIRITTIVEAFEAIARTLPVGSVGYENEIDERGEKLIWLEPNVLGNGRESTGEVCAATAPNFTRSPCFKARTRKLTSTAYSNLSSTVNWPGPVGFAVQASDFPVTEAPKRLSRARSFRFPRPSSCKDPPLSRVYG